MSEFIYVLTNPTMPNLVKIGRTTDLASRLRSLSSATGVPVPFECFFVCEVSDSLKVEKALHEAFGDHRINEKREFFRINPNRAVAILELVAINNVTLPAAVADTSEELEALHREQVRREVFRFRLADVPVGAVITFSKDSSVTDLTAFFVPVDLRELTRIEGVEHGQTWIRRRADCFQVKADRGADGAGQDCGIGV